MKNNAKVIILICELSSGWCHCNDIYVSYSSDRRIPRGSNCAYALSKLLGYGYELIDTQAMGDCGQVIYTLAKVTKTKPLPKPTPKPDICDICEEKNDDCSSIC
ncbi:hypothetical protein Z968_05630 [Clostridium novyi A str. 4552]|uniref:Uncharacterized protein n=1 Tax=Clostridium novyi A str. 4552 TaxID=1444289 RepID=A0A0A0IB40_CLONO|nr:hypothetical protein [Clostridium novyi]KGM96805.1 hypothetical protein Z968_05630 [Clostridium novyi A str. 4552]